METTAAVVHEAGAQFELETVELDDPRSNEILVDMTAVGLCHTDLSVKSGDQPTPLPAVLGHEGAGVVQEVGDEVDRVQPGDNVVLSFDYDDTCPNCHTGHPANCESFGERNFSGRRPDGTSPISLDGEEISGRFFGQSSFAEHAVVSEQSVVPVADDAPLDRLGPLGCGIQTGAGGVINSLDPAAGDSIVVFGAGSVGLSGVLGAELCGCGDVIVVDIVDSRLEKARDLGATDTVNSGDVDDLDAELRDRLGGGADYTLETTGVTDLLRQAVDLLRPTGVCGVIGAPPRDETVDIDVNGLLSGRNIRGIAEGDSVPPEFIPDLVDLHQQGRFPFDEFVTSYDFEDINQAVEDVHDGGVIKPVLTFD
ncbi:NAD(P)-dependent alcohol dehydrogenase [Salarchaeum sp. III]|uniref:NAD(P)-dependent alcohol dehydrogenase n=1 Tax=Salarchaeum sp. III TaxID=3107927 RepID=UPI002EDB375A